MMMVPRLTYFRVLQRYVAVQEVLLVLMANAAYRGCFVWLLRFFCCPTCMFCFDVLVVFPALVSLSWKCTHLPVEISRGTFLPLSDVPVTTMPFFFALLNIRVFEVCTGYLYYVHAEVKGRRRRNKNRNASFI